MLRIRTEPIRPLWSADREAAYDPGNVFRFEQSLQSRGRHAVQSR
jgi:hypothetical protein